MGAPAVILQKCAGLNTRDQLFELGNTYLSKGVNVDITDAGSVARRRGAAVVSGGYSNAHSLFGFLDRYAFFADGGTLFGYDVTSGAVSTVRTGLSSDKPICYTPVGSSLAYTNGSERGLITGTTNAPYFEFLPDPSQSNREIVEFPLVDLMCFYKGSMYGANKGGEFLYCSEPYKPAHHDQVGGYIPTTAPVQWVKGVGSALLVGQSDGVTAFAGSGVADFQERKVLDYPAISSSEYLSFRFEHEVRGVLVLTAGGVFFITDQLETVNMTSALPLNWGSVAHGVFGKVGNSYILTGTVE